MVRAFEEMAERDEESELLPLLFLQPRLHLPLLLLSTTACSPFQSARSTSNRSRAAQITSSRCRAVRPSLSFRFLQPSFTALTLFLSVLAPSGHLFHQGGITEALARQDLCPMKW